MNGSTSPRSPLLVWFSVGTLLVAGSLLACDDESIGTAEDGDLDISPQSITFSDTAVGDSAVQTATVENTSDGNIDVRLSNLDFGENPEATGSDHAFELLNPWEETEYVLGEGEEYTFEVEYTPQDAEAYDALISFDTNIADEDQAEIDIEVTAPTPAPELVADDTVNFSRIPPDTMARELTEVRNIGTADLVFDDIFLTGQNESNFDYSFPTPVDELDDDELASLEDELDDDQTIDDLDYAPEGYDRDAPPEAIAPGGSMLIRLYFEAEDQNFRSAQLALEQNDPDRPQHRIAIGANSDSPCLELLGGVIDFGHAAIDSTTQQTVTLENCSGLSETVITDMQLGEFDDDGEFQATDDVLFDIDEASLPGGLADGDVKSLDPDQATNFLVTYSPEVDEQLDEAVLQIESTDPRSPLEVDVLGIGADRECPIAHAQAGIAGTGVFVDDVLPAVPLDDIAFDGTESYDPDDPNQEVSYEWAITQEPPGSSANIDDPFRADPQMSVNIAGHYVVELMVYDEVGIPACDPAHVEIAVEPESAIHVELTWDVPAVPEGETGIGTDLDLHYLHPSGQWSQEPYGVFWNNDNPDWNDGSEVSLDIDDLYGDEPENINHDNPDPSYDYHTGVYYFGDDNNFGATDATIRIYYHDSLILEMEQQLHNAGIGLDPESSAGDFWYVARIGVTSQGPDVDQLEIIDQFYEDSGFPDLIEN